MGEKPVVPTLTSGIINPSTLNSALNTLAEAIASGVNRQGDSTGNNQMQGDLDMGGHTIKNIGGFDNIVDYTEQAAASAAEAEASATLVSGIAADIEVAQRVVVTTVAPQTAFVLAEEPNGTFYVYINGVYQNQTAYSIVGTTVTFTEEIPTGYTIEFIYGAPITLNPNRPLTIIENLTALRASSISTTKPSIYLRGHTTSGDGGGGIFIRQSNIAGTYTDDNGVTIVPTGGDGSDAWVRDYSGPVFAEWFGAVGDEVTDDTTAWQAAVDYVVSIGGGIIEMPAKAYLLEGSVSVGGPVIIKGSGVYDLENSRGITRPDGGSWFIHDSLTDPAFAFESNLGKGAGLESLGFFQTGHAVPDVGWVPTEHEYVIVNDNTQGTLRLKQVHFHNAYKGVYTSHAARPQYQDITGQFFYRGFTFDQIYDIGKFEGLHAWTYWSEDDNVLTWTQANGVSVTLLRVDGLWMDRIFSFGQSIAVYCGVGAVAGSAKVIQIGGLYADFTGRAVVIDTDTCHVMVSKLFHLGQAWPVTVPATVLTGACGVHVASGSNSLIQIGDYYSALSETASIKVEGASNQVWVTSELSENYDRSESGTGVHYTTVTNLVFVASTMHAVPYAGGTALITTSEVGSHVELPIPQIWSASDPINGVQATAGPTNVSCVIHPSTDSESNAGIQLLAKGTGKVLIASSGQKLGFFGATEVEKPTSVPVTAADIHAALVSLGLIGA